MARPAEKAKDVGTVHVTLRRSLIGEKPKTRKTVKGLGLGKMNSTVELPDNESVRGMIHAVRHLVAVEEDGSRKTEDGSQKDGVRRSEDGTRKSRRSETNADD